MINNEDLITRESFDDAVIKNVNNFSSIQINVVDDTLTPKQIIENATDGSTLVFPKGEYEISETIIIKNKSNINIVGNGAIVKCKVIKNSPEEGSQHITPFIIEDCNNITFEGITIDGGFANPSYSIYDSEENNSKLIKANNTNRLLFTKCIFVGQSTNRVTGDKYGRYDSGILIQNSDVITFRDCKYYDNVMEGIYIESSTNILIDGLQFDCKNIWSALDLFKCNKVDVINSNINVRQGKLDDAGTINVYSSNANISNCILNGGSGVDLSDEANVFKTDESNINITNCKINGKYGFHQAGDKFVDNVNVSNCEINAYYGLYLYHTAHCKMSNINFINNKFNVINALRYRALGEIHQPFSTSEGCDNEFSNITFDNNTIICKTIKESIEFNPILGASKGGSVAFVFWDEGNNTNGNEIVNNINITNNIVYCEAGLILIPNGCKFTPKNIKIKGNHVEPLPQLSNKKLLQPFIVCSGENVAIENNEFIDAVSGYIMNLNNFRFSKNTKLFKETQQLDYGYNIMYCHGVGIVKDNIMNNSLKEHFHCYRNDYSGFTKDNYPDTYKNQ